MLSLGSAETYLPIGVTWEFFSFIQVYSYYKQEASLQWKLYQTLSYRLAPTKSIKLQKNNVGTLRDKIQENNLLFPFPISQQK